jgi:Flp pilus assembly pilin Flp
MLMHMGEIWRSTVAGVRAVASRVARTAPRVAQSMVEYAIIAALVAVVALGAVKLLGTQISATFNHVTQSVTDADKAAAGP